MIALKFILNRKDFISNLKIFKSSEIIYFQVFHSYFIISNEQNQPENGILYIKFLYNTKSIAEPDFVSFGIEYDKFLDFILRLDTNEIDLDINLENKIININNILKIRILERKPNLFFNFHNYNNISTSDLSVISHVMISGKNFISNINKIKNIFNNKNENTTTEYNFIDVVFGIDHSITISATDTLRFVELKNKSKNTISQTSYSHLKLFKNTIPLLSEILNKSDWIDCYLKDKENIFKCESFSGEISTAYTLIMPKPNNYNYSSLPNMSKLLKTIDVSKKYSLNSINLLKQLKLIQNIAKNNVNIPNSIDLTFSKENLKFEVMASNEEYYVNNLELNTIEYDNIESKIFVDIEMFMSCIDIITSYQLDFKLYNINIEVGGVGIPIIISLSEKNSENIEIYATIICSTFN